LAFSFNKAINKTIDEMKEANSQVLKEKSHKKWNIN
jgi:hypothetical protein